MSDIFTEILMFLIRMIAVFLVLCSSAFGQGLVYDATEILGFEPTATLELPATCEANEVFVRYDGWSLNELREKIRERQDVEIEFWHTVQPFAKKRLEPRVYRLVRQKADWQQVRFTWAGSPAPTVIVASAAFAHRIKTGKNLFADVQLDNRPLDALHGAAKVGDELLKIHIEENEPRFLNVCRENFHGRGLMMEWQGEDDKRLHISHSSSSHVQDAQQVCRHLFDIPLTKKQIAEIGGPPKLEWKHVAVFYDPGWSLEEMSNRFANKGVAIVRYDEKDKGEWLTKKEKPRYRRIRLAAGWSNRTFAEQLQQLEEGEEPISARVLFLAIVALKSEGYYIMTDFNVRTGDVLPDGRRVVLDHFGVNINLAPAKDDLRDPGFTLGSMDK